MRDFDAARINAIVNDPSVFPWVALPDQEKIDLAPIVADLRNIVLVEDGIGMIAHAHEPGIYEVHTQAIESARGLSALNFVHRALHWLFTKTDAMELYTQVPKNNPSALGLVRAIQGELEFTRKAVWPTKDGLVDVSYWAMRFHRWIRTSPLLANRGHWFHERLIEEKLRFGVNEPLHPDDLYHDKMVGATVDMILAGQLDKGIILYNRWARFAGYAEIRVESRAPVVVDIQDAVLLVADNDFRVISCRSEQ